MKPTYALIIAVLFASSAFAQPGPLPGRDGGGGGGPPGRRDDRGGPPEGRGGGGGDHRPPPRGDGPPPDMEPRMKQFEYIRGYLEMVDRYARLARDPSMAGIASVITAGEILKPRGADAAIDYFTKLLPEVKSPGVQRAVRLQLIDLYKAAGKQDQALEQLKMLMTAEPGPNDLAPPTPRPPGGPGGPGER